MTDWNTPISDASDEQIRQALEQAHIPALMTALMHLNGNRDHALDIYIKRSNVIQWIRIGIF